MKPRRPVVIANAIRLTRSQHSGTFVIVEGRDDRLLCDRFIDSAHCRVTVAECKATVCDVVSILDEDGFQGALGLVDSDFDRVEGRRPTSPNLVSFEHHDLECMLLRSTALEAVLVEFGSEPKLAAFGRDIRDTLLSAAIPIGCLRLYSERTGLNLRFDGIRYAEIIDDRSLKVDRHGLVLETMNRSQRPDLPVDITTEEIRRIELEAHDPWEICSGSDLLEILSVGLRRVMGNNNANSVKNEALRRALRLAYSPEEFSRSQLCDSMRQWERANPPFRVIR